MLDSLVEHLLARAPLKITSRRLIRRTIGLVNLRLRALNRRISYRIDTRILQIRLLSRNSNLLKRLIARILVVHQLDASERVRKTRGEAGGRLESYDICGPIFD